MTDAQRHQAWILAAARARNTCEVSTQRLVMEYIDQADQFESDGALAAADLFTTEALSAAGVNVATTATV